MSNRSRKKNVPAKSEKNASKKLPHKKMRSKPRVVQRIPKNKGPVEPISSMDNLEENREYDPIDIRMDDTENVDSTDGSSPVIDTIDIYHQKSGAAAICEDASSNGDGLQYRMMHGYADLPDFILLKIFSSLTIINDVIACGRVCYSWHQISRHKSLWNNIILNAKSLKSHEFDEFFQKLPSSVSYLKVNGCLRNGLVLTKEFLSVLQKKCPNLKVLLVEDFMLISYFQDPNFDIGYLPSNVIIVSCRRSIVHHEVVWKFDTTSANFLTVVDFSFCTSIKNKHLQWFYKMMNLKKLYLAGCSIDDGGVRYLSGQKCLTSYFRSKLEVLDLEETKVSDESLYLIDRHLPCLEKLYVGRTDITFVDHRFLTETQRFSSLTDLCLKHAPVDCSMLCALIQLESMKCLNVISNDIIKNCILNLSENLQEKFKLHDQNHTQCCDHFNSDNVCELSKY